MEVNKLNILFITQDDPFYIPYFFKEFDSILDDDKINIAGIIIQVPFGKKSVFKLMKQMFDFYGIYNFIKIGIKYIFFKTLNIFAVKIFKGNFPGCFSLKHFLLKRKYNILNVSNVNSEDSMALLKKMNLDLIVSVAASQKFKEKMFEIPKYGCVNVHNSRLPKNRGMLPNFWSLYNCDINPLSGITVHKINKAIDDGPILIQEDLILNPKESLHNLMIRTKILSSHLVLKAIKLFKDGEPSVLPNDSAQATYNTFPSKEDVKNFKKKGLRLL